MKGKKIHFPSFSKKQKREGGGHSIFKPLRTTKSRSITTHRAFGIKKRVIKFKISSLFVTLLLHSRLRGKKILRASKIYGKEREDWTNSGGQIWIGSTHALFLLYVQVFQSPDSTRQWTSSTTTNTKCAAMQQKRQGRRGKKVFGRDKINFRSE